MTHVTQHSDEKFGDLDLFFLLDSYRSERLTPREVIAEVMRRISEKTSEAEWVFLETAEQLLKQAEMLESKDRCLPLYGIPFSIKDNINIKGLPTSSGCARYSHIPEDESPVVRQLIEMGAILVGKNSMDEFATGVVGVRSDPHPVNPFDARYICGGSSSGSGVVVAQKTVCFSLGSDTGGSGRVPAALCNIVGFKPTPHRLSNEGMIYANRSIDCIPIFSKTAREAEYIFDNLLCDKHVTNTNHFKEDDGLSKLFNGATIAVPRPLDLAFFGDNAARDSFSKSIDRLRALGSRLVEIDFQPFVSAGKLLFEGAFLNERFDAVGAFINENRTHVNPVVADVILQSETTTRAEIWKDLSVLNQCRLSVENSLSHADILMTPTVGTIYKIDDMKADPIKLNQNMAYYTNFGNLLHLSVVSVPSFFRSDGLPFGVSFMAPMMGDHKALNYAKAWELLNKIPPAFN